MAIFNGRLPVIDEKEVRRYAGLQRAEDFPEQYVKEACLEVQLEAVPRGIYHEYAYDAATGTIQSDPPLVVEGSSIRKHLASSVRVAVMGVTIGEGVERRSAALFKDGNYTVGLLVDAAATTAVEQVADQINDLIVKAAAAGGYTTTWRFSPGYGNWPLDVQPALAAIIGAEEIGLTVTDTCMLFPRKSVTAIIGYMPGGATLQTKRGCTSCGQRDCPSRKKP